MSALELLKPTGNRRVMDLVRDAGVDVAAWADFAGGARRAAMNPKYCYEWAFVQPHSVVVLNVWYAALREKGSNVTLTDNLKAMSARHAQFGTGKSAVWTARASRFDHAVATAAAESLAIRAVICDGTRRAANDPNARASRVVARMLDPVPWSVQRYDVRTGEFTLKRGALAGRAVDQFSLGEPLVGPTEVRSVNGKAFVRSLEVRDTVLSRAGGRCQWCGEPGFTMMDGSVFLETHHVIPLSEGGPDVITNVVALCPNHHREVHYGAARHSMRERLLLIAATRSGRQS